MIYVLYRWLNFDQKVFLFRQSIITNFLGCPFLVHLGLEESHSMLKYYWRASHETIMVMPKRCVWNKAFLLYRSNLLVKSHRGTIYMKGKEKFIMILCAYAWGWSVASNVYGIVLLCFWHLHSKSLNAFTLDSWCRSLLFSTTHFCHSVQNVPITSILSDFTLGSWKDFDVGLSLIGSKEIIWNSLPVSREQQ